MKIAVIGAGSFVFGTSILSELTLNHKLDGVDVALMDVDREALFLMAGVGQRMADEAGLTGTRVTAETDRAKAIDGAEFVLNAAAPQMARRFTTDCEIIERHLPGHIVTEFGGVVGISYSLRQIAFIRGLTEEMQRLCPGAWLLDVANPMPRVCQAANMLGVKTAGFCSAALEGYAMLWHLFTGERIGYPYQPARQRWEVLMGGLNHFSWVLKLTDRESGKDLLPAIRERLATGASTGWPISDEISKQTGFLLVPNDHHTQDFLPPMRPELSRGTTWHGSTDERQRRMKTLRDISEGKTALHEVTRQGSWEKPADLIAAATTGRESHLEMLNLVNTGQVPELPRGIFVETPCRCTPAGPVAENIELPPAVADHCRRVADQTDTVVHAGLQRKRELVYHAVELDPTIIDKAAGRAAIDEVLTAHADMLGEFS